MQAHVDGCASCFGKFLRGGKADTGNAETGVLVGVPRWAEPEPADRLEARARPRPLRAPPGARQGRDGRRLLGLRQGARSRGRAEGAPGPARRRVDRGRPDATAPRGAGDGPALPPERGRGPRRRRARAPGLRGDGARRRHHRPRVAEGGAAAVARGGRGVPRGGRGPRRGARGEPGPPRLQAGQPAHRQGRPGAGDRLRDRPARPAARPRHAAHARGPRQGRCSRFRRPKERFAPPRRARSRPRSPPKARSSAPRATWRPSSTGGASPTSAPTSSRSRSRSTRRSTASSRSPGRPPPSGWSTPSAARSGLLRRTRRSRPRTTGCSSARSRPTLSSASARCTSCSSSSRRNPAIVRRRIAFAASAVALAGLAIAFTAYQGRQRTALCTGAEARLVGIWDGTQREAIHAAFAKTGVPFAEDSFELAASALDGYAAGWVRSGESRPGCENGPAPEVIVESCPKDEEVAALARGELEGDAAAKVQQHVNGCAGCFGKFLRGGQADTGNAETGVLVGAPRWAEPPRAIDWKPGRDLGRYVLLEELGRGGMGVVYAAYDPELDRAVALKVLHPQADDASTAGGQARLLREAQAMARLSHPNVVAVHDVAVLEHRVFVVMELVEGSTVREWLKAAPRPWREMVAVFRAAGRGPRGGARGGPDPPRLQAGQRAHRQGRPGAGDRLRDRPARPAGGSGRRSSVVARRSGGRVRGEHPARPDASGWAAQPARERAHPGGRGRRHPALHGARAVPPRRRQLPHRPVLARGLALRGALRPVPVRGEERRRADGARRARRGAARARGLEGASRDPPAAPARALARPRAPLRLDARAARRAREGSRGRPPAARGRRLGGRARRPGDRVHRVPDPAAHRALLRVRGAARGRVGRRPARGDPRLVREDPRALRRGQLPARRDGARRLCLRVGAHAQGHLRGDPGARRAARAGDDAADGLPRAAARRALRAHRGVRARRPRPGREGEAVDRLAPHARVLRRRRRALGRDPSAGGPEEAGAGRPAPQRAHPRRGARLRWPARRGRAEGARRARRGEPARLRPGPGRGRGAARLGGEPAAAGRGVDRPDRARLQPRARERALGHRSPRPRSRSRAGTWP